MGPRPGYTNQLNKKQLKDIVKFCSTQPRTIVEIVNNIAAPHFVIKILLDQKHLVWIKSNTSNLKNNYTADFAEF